MNQWTHLSKGELLPKTVASMNAYKRGFGYSSIFVSQKKVIFFTGKNVVSRTYDNPTHASIARLCRAMGLAEPLSDTSLRVSLIPVVFGGRYIKASYHWTTRLPGHVWMVDRLFFGTNERNDFRCLPENERKDSYVEHRMPVPEPEPAE